MADALPESLASVLSQSEADSLRQKLLQLPEPPPRPSLTKDDALRALGICLWVFASTFPVVVPFLFIGEVQPALRLSNAVAIAHAVRVRLCVRAMHGTSAVADRTADGRNRLCDGRCCDTPWRLRASSGKRGNSGARTLLVRLIAV